MDRGSTAVFEGMEEKKRIIRLAGLRKEQGGKWGLPIVRCTYTSDARWERYLYLIYEDIYNTLHEDPPAEDLLSTLSCPIIEDRARLEGATIKDARTKYDEWAWDQIRGLQDTILEEKDPFVVESYQKAKSIFAEWDASEVQPARKEGKTGIPRMTVGRLNLLLALTEPRWSYFIFADEASVDSVVDHAEERERSGCYYFTTVRSDMIVRSHGIGDDDLLFDAEESYEFINETRRKIKAYNLFNLIHAIIDNEWDYGFLPGDDDICDLF